MTNNKLLNAVVGAAVTLLLSFTGVSPVLGGAVAAWLQEGDQKESIEVGTLSGLFAVGPLLLILFVVFGLIAGGSVSFALLVLVLAGIATYFAALGALGGFLLFYILKDRRIPGERDGPSSAV